MELSFDEFEIYREAAIGWGLEFVQLDRGPFQGALRQAASPQISLTHFRLNRQFHQQGAIQAPGRTFAIFLNRVTPMRWRNDDGVGADTLVVFPVDGELDAMTLPGFDAVSISIDKDFLREISQQQGLERACDVIPRYAITFQTDGNMIERVRRGVRRLLAAHAHGASGTQRMPIEAGIAESILRIVATDLQPAAPPGVRKRDRAFAAAMEVLTQSAMPPSVSELSHIVGASERTLRYAFRERLGVSVKHYMNARRLMRVKEQLLAADRGKSPIQDIATQFGYWHTGQFAADYRSMFGELPSETLMRRSDA